jgi:hypothetical protein
VTMTANRVGTANFAADPADIAPTNDTLTYLPAQPVTPGQTRFGFDSLRVVSAPGGASGEHNSTRPLDVNNDGHVSAIDALLIINQLNGVGLGSGEGESSSNYFPDTSNDGRVSALDALLVINYLNNRSLGQGEGEGEGEAAPGIQSDGLSSKSQLKSDSLNSSAFEELRPSKSEVATSSRAAGLVGFATHADLLFGQSDDEEEGLESLIEDLASGVDQELSSGL